MKNIFIKLAIYGFAIFGLGVSIALIHDELFPTDFRSSTQLLADVKTESDPLKQLEIYRRILPSQRNALARINDTEKLRLQSLITEIEGKIKTLEKQVTP